MVLGTLPLEDQGRGGGWKRGGQQASIPPQQPRQLALDLHLLGPVALRVVMAVGRVEADHLAFAAEGLQRRFLVVDQGDHDLAVAGRVLACGSAHNRRRVCLRRPSNCRPLRAHNARPGRAGRRGRGGCRCPAAPRSACRPRSGRAAGYRGRRRWRRGAARPARRRRPRRALASRASSALRAPAPDWAGGG